LAAAAHLRFGAISHLDLHLIGFSGGAGSVLPVLGRIAVAKAGNTEVAPPVSGLHLIADAPFPHHGKLFSTVWKTDKMSQRECANCRK
jgi:hypothetical protein